MKKRPRLWVERLCNMFSKGVYIAACRLDLRKTCRPRSIRTRRADSKDGQRKKRGRMVVTRQRANSIGARDKESLPSGLGQLSIFEKANVEERRQYRLMAKRGKRIGERRADRSSHLDLHTPRAARRRAAGSPAAARTNFHGISSK